MFNLFKKKPSEKGNPAMLRNKLQNHFIECVQQAREMRRYDLKSDINPLNGVLTVEEISVLDGSTCVGWIQGIEKKERSDVLTVKHIAMDTNYTNHGYGELMVLGFAKAIKKQFPGINYIDFTEFNSKDLSSEKIKHYTSFFLKCNMTPQPSDDYRLTL